jgi:2-iminobutanoate/2-iminopropanoate deaminase
MKKMLPFGLTIITLIIIGFSFTDKPGERRIILTDKAPKPIGPYSQAILVDNTLYVAGQVGLTLEGKLDSTSIEMECQQALKNIKAIVEAAGMSMQQVVKSTLYVNDLKNWTKINNVYGQYFQTDPPARETVQIAGLPKGAHFEISVVAVK